MDKSLQDEHNENEVNVDNITQLKSLHRIVNASILIEEQNNDCALMTAAYTVSTRLVVINVVFQRLLNIVELSELVCAVPFETDEYLEQVKDSIVTLKNVDPALKFFWSYHALFISQWRKSHKHTVPSTNKLSPSCFYFMSCYSYINAKVKECYSKSLATAWLTYNVNETSAFIQFLGPQLDKGTHSDKKLFDPYVPLDPTNIHWVKMFSLICKGYTAPIKQVVMRKPPKKLISTDSCTVIPEQPGFTQSMNFIAQQHVKIDLLEEQRLKYFQERDKIDKEISKVDREIKAINADIQFTMIQILEFLNPCNEGSSDIIVPMDPVLTEIYGIGYTVWIDVKTPHELSNIVLSDSSTLYVSTTDEERFNILHPQEDVLRNLSSTLDFLYPGDPLIESRIPTKKDPSGESRSSKKVKKERSQKKERSPSKTPQKVTPRTSGRVNKIGNSKESRIFIDDSPNKYESTLKGELSGDEGKTTDSDVDYEDSNLDIETPESEVPLPVHLQVPITDSRSKHKDPIVVTKDPIRTVLHKDPADVAKDPAQITVHKDPADVAKDPTQTVTHKDPDVFAKDPVQTVVPKDPAVAKDPVHKDPADVAKDPAQPVAHKDPDVFAKDPVQTVAPKDPVVTKDPVKAATRQNPMFGSMDLGYVTDNKDPFAAVKESVVHKDLTVFASTESVVDLVTSDHPVRDSIQLECEGVGLARVPDSRSPPEVISTTLPNDIADLLDMMVDTPRNILDSVLSMTCNQEYMSNSPWSDILITAYSLRRSKDRLRSPQL
jgi:hypothetical protein